MSDFAEEELQEALRAIASMISRTEQTKRKFAQGTSHYTLQKNRLEALHIASSLSSGELAGSHDPCRYSQEDLKKAAAPIASLISKSEKAQRKLAQDSWQYTRLENNLKALHIAVLLLAKALSGADACEGP